MLVIKTNNHNYNSKNLVSNCNKQMYQKIQYKLRDKKCIIRYLLNLDNLIQQ